MKHEEPKASARYGVAGNVLFMIRQALDTSPIVLVFTLLQALPAVTA